MTFTMHKQHNTNSTNLLIIHQPQKMHTKTLGFEKVKLEYTSDLTQTLRSCSFFVFITIIQSCVSFEDNVASEGFMSSF